tara:strand:- start:342 stop:1838 length:1497 start_codon:yes stop_codon:yes gene_type:complete
MIDIIIMDEINCAIEGLEPDELSEIASEFSFPIKDAHMQVAFQLKQWDGRESIIDIDHENDTGYTYLYYMEQVIERIMELYGYSEYDINIVDERDDLPDFGDEPVPENYMEAEYGYPYREHQHRIVNNAIEKLNGIFDAATSAGKTLICASIAKYFQPWLKSLTIVPTDYLLKQTAKEFKECGLDVIAIESKIPTKKRPQKIREHKHIVITWRLLNNLLKYEMDNDDICIYGEKFVVMYDELQEFGDTMIDAFKDGLHNCPIRFGMSGTVPDKDKWKKANIIGCIGDGVIDVAPVRYLMDKGYASEANIKMVDVVHEEIEELCTEENVKEEIWNWGVEKNYYANEKRAEAIGDYIKTLDLKNTLILCHPDLGWELSKYLGVEMIDKDTDIEERQRLFDLFESKEDHMFCATFRTVGTGVSANKIYRGIIIDVGKNDVNIRQGIGRLIRLDGVYNEADIIDISANTYFSKKHRKDRKRIYRKHKYKFEENFDQIIVEGD